ncbi:MAG: T9SS type A sorting domain-containing protein [Saprospiraceae bacterium]|nr:T9SS type A sorting domain-containing protein [Lewinellaceae bacterium]
MRYIFYILVFLANGLMAQSTALDHAYLSTDNITVHITPTGIHADKDGNGFVFNGVSGLPINLLSHLTPWIAGLDPAGNIHISCELDAQKPSDWKAGYRNIPNSDKVWKVTQEQIGLHLSDYLDNGIIDNPIPEVFAWPGRGNPFSLEYNGFEIPSDWTTLTAGYFDTNENGQYDPENGEYPTVIIRGGTFWLAPDQMAFSIFYNDTIGDLTKGFSTATEVAFQSFTFNCNNDPVMENSVFLAYKCRNFGVERMDSCFFGIYSNFDIGNPNDDYLGCDLYPYKDFIYAYNADTLFDSRAGPKPPIVGLNFLRGPLDSNAMELNLKKVMPILANASNPALRFPTFIGEYYNYLSGSWRDGTPLTYGGIGYGGNTLADAPFTGLPSDGNAWSELSANNPLGDRRAVSTFQDFTLLPGAVNELIVSISASNSGSLTENLEELRTFNYLHRLINEYHNDDLHDICFPTIATHQPSKTNEISIFPNPGNDHVTVHSSASPIEEITLFNMLGHWVGKQKSSAGTTHALSMETGSLPPGVYLVSWRLQDGTMGSGNVVVGR